MKGKEGGGKGVGGGGTVEYGATTSSMATTRIDDDESALHDLLTAPLIPGSF